jgi:hypothetical protein
MGAYEYQETSAPVLWTSVASIDVNWLAQEGFLYQLQYCEDLTTPVWSNIGAAVTGMGSNVYINEGIRGMPQRFYRVVVPDPQ